MRYQADEGYGAVDTLLLLGFLLVAAGAVGLVLRLREAGRFGWLCLALALILVVGEASWEMRNDWYNLRSFLERLNGLAWSLYAPPLPVTLMLLIYPTGRLLSRHWWIVVWIALSGTGLSIITEYLNRWADVSVPGTLGPWIALVALLLSVVAIVVRWRRSEGRERQQIKWLVYAVGVTLIALLCALASWYIQNDIPGAQSYSTLLASMIAFAGVSLGIPLAIEFARQLRPDVILMDIKMPDINGIEATREVVSTNPTVGVLVVTMLEDDDSVFAAMRAGARGYLLKGAEQAEVLRAIRAVANGEAIFGPGIARRVMGLFSAEKPEVPQAFPELTEREQEILRLIAGGRGNAEISSDLFLSLKTVQNHVSNIFRKLQVADRAQAVIRAREAGLGDGP